MKTTSIIAILAVIVLGGISAYTISPYLTNSTIDEALPENIITKKLSDDSNTSSNLGMTKQEDEKTMMMEEEAMMKDQDKTIAEKEMTNLMMFYNGDFVGVNDGIHNAEGKAKVIPLDDGTSILRLEDFESTNGPDLYVYLSTDEKASDYVNLGRLKANSGNQNYEIPEDVNLSKHKNVLIWCKAFGVLFGSAELHP